MCICISMAFILITMVIKIKIIYHIFNKYNINKMHGLLIVKLYNMYIYTVDLQIPCCLAIVYFNSLI